MTVLTTPLPFTTRDYAARMARAEQAVRTAGLDGIVLAPGPDLLWLTGYEPTALTERLTLLVLSPGLGPVLIVPALERLDAEAVVGAAGCGIVEWVDGSDPYRLASALLKPGGRFGISDSAWSAHLLGLQAATPSTHYQTLSQSLPLLRAVKEQGELCRLTTAGLAADATYAEIVHYRFAGRRERDVAADLARLLREFGHQQIDFTVVGSGPNGANPQHEAGDRVIEKRDVVVLDIGGRMFGYGSETARTVSVGEPSPETRRLHDIVRRAQQAAFEAVRPGVSAERIDRVARDVITEAGYGARFIHRTGHGIGVTTQEPPYLVKGVTQPLEPGMCFSIEPGIYLPGRFGVRIADIVTVTDTGAERLNNTGRDLRVVG
ncbi:MAG: M24 family metallopeptidase [Labedaea sp.]